MKLFFLLHGLHDIPVQNGVPQDSLCALTPRCVWTNIDFVTGHETVPMVMMKNSVSLLHRMRKLQGTSHTTQKVNNYPKRKDKSERNVINFQIPGIYVHFDEDWLRTRTNNV